MYLSPAKIFFWINFKCGLDWGIPLKGQSHEIFCTRFFPPNSSSWSHLIFLASWLSYRHFKMTPWCPVHWRVETPRGPMYRGVKTPRCPMYRGVTKLDPLKIQKSPKYQRVETPRCPRYRELGLPGVLCTGESRLFSTLWVKTPRCPMYRGVAKLDPLKIQNSPKYQGVVFCFFEPSSPCCSL